MTIYGDRCVRSASALTLYLELRLSLTFGVRRTGPLLLLVIS